jgi:hypothetical protein
VHKCEYLDKPGRPFHYAAHAVALRYVGGYFTELYWLYQEYALELQLKEAEQFGILREVSNIYNLPLSCSP